VDGVDSVAAVGVVVPVAATVVDIAVGVVALLPTKRCGSAMQLSQTSPHLDAINPQGQLGIGRAQGRIWIRTPQPSSECPAALGLRVSLFSYLSKRNMNLVGFCLPLGTVTSGLCMRWLWSCGSNGMYNNRPGARQARPSSVEEEGWQIVSSWESFFFFSIISLHRIIDNQIYQLRLDCAWMWIEILGVNHGSGLADMDIIISRVSNYMSLRCEVLSD
jgi:hypothetical protein